MHHQFHGTSRLALKKHVKYKMVSKLVFLLALVGACVAYPYPLDNQPLQPAPPAVLSNDQILPEPIPMASEPQGQMIAAPGPQEAIALPPQAIPAKPEDTDLKTDATYWYRRSYYPTYYYRSYYRPRSFSSSYYSYTPYWKYW